MKKFYVIACTASLVACVSPQELERNRAAILQTQRDLNNSSAHTAIACNNKASCDKAFSLAKIYIQENSSMKIQISDDTIISTYNPTQYGDVALNATKIPGSGESAMIQIVASCKGMTDQGYFFSVCANRIIQIYSGFKSFILPKL